VIRHRPTKIGESTRGLILAIAAPFAAAIAWTFVAAIASGGSPWPTVLLLAGCAATVAVAAILASYRPAMVAGLAVAVAAVIALVDVEGTFSAHPLAGPFGYVNARASFFALAAAAGLMLAVTGGPRATIVGVVAALVFALVPFEARSWAAAALLLLPLLALAAGRRGQARRVVPAFGALLVLAIAASAVAGAAAGRGASGPIERRTALWHDAIAIAADHPVFGVGPGGFADVSPVARRDADTARAHNEYLQAAAELGIPGAIAVVAIFAWTLRLLGRNPVSRWALVAASAVAMTGLHAVVDYVLHEPAVALMTAAIAGAGIGSRPDRREHEWDRS
jgi:O-antigen ligase